MNNNQMNELIKTIKKINTVEEVIILERNKNYFASMDLSLSILSKQPSVNKNNIDAIVKTIIDDYNKKYNTNIEYNDNDNYHDVFSKIIYGINIRLNQIFEDELNKFILEKMVNNNG
jgi:hypothetical protein